MLIRITGEFESSDIAEIVSGRIKRSVSGIRKTGIIYNREAIQYENIAHKTKFTLIPSAITRENYFTAVVESEISPNIIEEPRQRSKAYLYIICDVNSAMNVKSLMSSYGGINIKASDS